MLTLHEIASDSDFAAVGGARYDKTLWVLDLRDS